MGERDVMIGKSPNKSSSGRTRMGIVDTYPRQFFVRGSTGLIKYGTWKSVGKMEGRRINDSENVKPARVRCEIGKEE